MSQPRVTWVVVVASAVLGLATWYCIPPDAAQIATSNQVPQRIVCFSPALTEIVYAIGAGPRVVGVTDFCDQPSAARLLPRCGGMINPNLERLVSLAPDLVVLQGENEPVRQFCAANKLRYWTHRLDSLAHLMSAVEELGRVLAAPQARAVVDGLRRDLAEVQQATSRLQAPRVFICIGRQADRVAGLTTCGPNTFLHEVIALAGGVNIFGDAALLYPQPAVEAITARQPEVIIDFQPGLTDDAAAAAAAQWSVLGTLPAVRDHRVHVLTDNRLMVPGPRIGAATRQLAKLLHPELP